MALCYLPCVGEAGVLLRPRANLPSISVLKNNSSAVSFHSASSWSIDPRRYHWRRPRRKSSFSFQLYLKHSAKAFRNPWILLPTASVAQSRRPPVISEGFSSDQLLAVKYGSTELSSEDQESDERKVHSTRSTIDSQEQLRRDRIASANKGKVPWNKGKRHSPETIKKIKERTRVAMLNPEVRDKLRHSGKNQSIETKAKIRESLIDYWNRRRILNEAQALCVREWKEVIAEAARVGDLSEEVYEWDSYAKVKEQYRLEEIQAEKQAREARRARQRVERKKKPVSDAHRKAISDAIRAKWADPEYQAKVFAGMAKSDVSKRRKRLSSVIGSILDTPSVKVAPAKVENTLPSVEEILVEKKRPLQPTDVDEDFIAQVLAEEVTLKTKCDRSIAARKKGPTKVTLVSRKELILSTRNDNKAVSMEDRGVKQEVDTFRDRPVSEIDVNIPTTERVDIQLSNKLSAQSFKDPLVLEKIQRIQQLREGRLEIELKRKEAADRARMLIANAEKAAIALENSGNADPATLATLRETRRLLAEATRSVQAAELKPGNALDDLTSPRILEPNENEKFVQGGFHSRLWTEGDNLEDCPHPIPIRNGQFGGNLNRSDYKEIESTVRLPAGFEDHTEETVSEERQNSAVEGSLGGKSLGNGIKEKLQRNRPVQSTENEST